MPRFDKGDLVRVSEKSSEHFDRVGSVMAVVPDPFGSYTLDEYVVQFSPEEEARFFDFSLMPVKPQ